MKVPRVRYTVRRMMVVVAVACIALGGLAWQRRRAERDARRAFYVGRVRMAESLTGTEITAYMVRGVAAGPDVLVRLNGARAAYLAEMRRKYERAAERPDEPVAPDPPLPVRMGGPDRMVTLKRVKPDPLSAK